MAYLPSQQKTIASSPSVFATNVVLRNTYGLLGLTLVFSGLIAWWAAAINAPSLGLIVTLIGIYGLMFLTQALRNSPWGLVSCFAFTGFMGYTLGPLLNLYIHNFNNGAELVGMAAGGTGIIFLGLSAYVLITKKDFSYLGGFIFIGLMALLIAILIGIFVNIPGLQLAISAGFILIASGLILFQTSQIIYGGERNYIMATIALYVSIYNLFVSLLSILGAFSGRR